MNERKQERKEKYQRARSDFDELDTEEKVVFLLEATVSTVARGIDELGRAVSNEINRAFNKRSERKARHGTEANGTSGAAGAEGGTPPPENTEGRTEEKGDDGL